MEPFALEINLSNWFECAQLAKIQIQSNFWIFNMTTQIQSNSIKMVRIQKYDGVCNKQN